VPKKGHDAYQSLGKRAKQVVRVGAALLRVADGLDRTHSNVVTGLSCEVGKHAVDVTIKPRGDAELELWGARQKSDLFTDVFGRDVTFAKAGR
jgi:exopolyphosphatase/guanosine-5'-triphosphate,3'-diphosphate pyrophosphatase